MNDDNALALESVQPDSKAIGAIRAGLNQDPEFWTNFLKICNQSANLSVLLGVRREVIARWPSVIREHLEHVRRLDSEDAVNKRANLITTGY
jgi:hypothetical protein